MDAINIKLAGRKFPPATEAICACNTFVAIDQAQMCPLCGSKHVSCNGDQSLHCNRCLSSFNAPHTCERDAVPLPDEYESAEALVPPSIRPIPKPRTVFYRRDSSGELLLHPMQVAEQDTPVVATTTRPSQERIYGVRRAINMARRHVWEFSVLVVQWFITSAVTLPAFIYGTIEALIKPGVWLWQGTESMLSRPAVYETPLGPSLQAVPPENSTNDLVSYLRIKSAMLPRDNKLPRYLVAQAEAYCREHASGMSYNQRLLEMAVAIPQVMAESVIDQGVRQFIALNTAHDVWQYNMWQRGVDLSYNPLICRLLSYVPFTDRLNRMLRLCWAEQVLPEPT